MSRINVPLMMSGLARFRLWPGHYEIKLSEIKLNRVSDKATPLYYTFNSDVCVRKFNELYRFFSQQPCAMLKAKRLK